MQDSKKQRPDNGVVDSDATSKETLADVEENEQSSNSGSEGTAREAPSPDGTLDESNEIKERNGKRVRAKG